MLLFRSEYIDQVNLSKLCAVKLQKFCRIQIHEFFLFWFGTSSSSQIVVYQSYSIFDILRGDTCSFLTL